MRKEENFGKFSQQFPASTNTEQLGMEMLIMSWSVLPGLCEAGLWTVTVCQWAIFSILSYPQHSPVGRGAKGEEIETLEANREVRDWVVVANYSYLLTCLSQHSCSTRLYWTHLPVEFTTTAFVNPSSPSPNLAPTCHPQHNSSYCIHTIGIIQFGLPSLLL